MKEEVPLQCDHKTGKGGKCEYKASYMIVQPKGADHHSMKKKLNIKTRAPEFDTCPDVCDIRRAFPIAKISLLSNTQSKNKYYTTHEAMKLKKRDSVLP